MYRRDYPDIPGMFDARFSEYNRPSIYREFQNSWLISIIGLAMVLTGCGILFWNEGRAVKTAVSLEEGFRDVHVPETVDVVFEENNGKLLLISGPLVISDPLQDNTYGVSINAVKLRKVVQVYQWYETEDQQASHNTEAADHDSHATRSYSYSTGWFENHIDSSNFYNTLGHHNPHEDQWPANSSLTVNPRVKIGNFLLGSALKEKFEDFKPFTSDERPRLDGVKIYAGLYYHSANIWDPQVGDYRVQFAFAGRQGEEFTVVGRQSGRELRPYKTESGEELLILQEGLRSPADVFSKEHNINRTATWIYRLAGWFVTFLGLSCLSTLLEMVLDSVPTLRQMVALGMTSLHFAVSITLTLLIIGTGWMWYRPLVGMALLAVSLVPYSVPLLRVFLQRRQHRFAV